MTAAGMRTIALAGIVGPVLFTTLVLVQGFLQPEYSHVKLPISALAAWPTGWIQNLNFCACGLLIMTFAFALNSSVKPARVGRAGFALLLIGAAGVFAAGLFPWKMVDGVPTETSLHVAAAIPAFAATALGIIAISSRLNADPRWRDLAAYSKYSGILLLVLFITFGFFGIDDGAPLHPWAGLIQRIACTVWFAWLIVLALRFRTV